MESFDVVSYASPEGIVTGCYCIYDVQDGREKCKSQQEKDIGRALVITTKSTHTIEGVSKRHCGQVDAIVYQL